MIFLFSSPRSGSTWLAKLFDSHPDLLYLHEPDIPDRGVDLLPYWFERAPNEGEIENAKLYFQRVTARRCPRTVGILPYFEKSYRGPYAEIARRGLIYLSKGLERVGISRVLNVPQIPDLTKTGTTPRIVVKSVGALGRAEALVAANASMIPLLLIRHPCGFVASMLRGEQLGVMPRHPRLGRMAATRSARRLGLPELDNADDSTLLAWSWLISNAEAIVAVKRAGGVVLLYEDVARDPGRHIRQLFERFGLGWPRQTEAFIAQSQELQGGYYSIFRTPREGVEQWRTELDEPTVSKIRAIVERDPLGASFFEVHGLDNRKS